MLEKDKFIWHGKPTLLFFVDWLISGIALCIASSWQLNRLKRWKSTGPVKWNVKNTAVLLLTFSIISGLIAFPSQNSSAKINVQGDQEKIKVTIPSFSPVLDRYGQPSVNPDGTFYPNDKFALTYNVDVAKSVVFDGVEATYDQSVLNLFSTDNWGAQVGSGSFAVASSVAFGTYGFSIRAWGSTLFDREGESSGTVSVTHGGVDVKAYYTTQHLLSITASSSIQGTTNPVPGEYWLNSGSIMTILAIPSSGYLFSHWLLDGHNASTHNTITVNMNSYHSLQACFTLDNDAITPNLAYTNTTNLYTQTEQFNIQATQTSSEFENNFSAVTFMAHGLGTDAAGPALALDEVNQLNTNQLPTTFNWTVYSTHAYHWLEIVSSTNIGQRYVLTQVIVKEKYLSIATMQVEVVKYDPHFTLTLAYTVPNSNGNSSYDKPFALIIRYDGNGPNYNLAQRAIIESYSWAGHAQKTAGLENMPQTLTPNVSSNIANFFNQTTNAQFSAYGIDCKTNTPILTVDGKTFRSDEFPKVFGWDVNSNHTYSWTQQLPIVENENAGTFLGDVDSFYEWLEWQFCLAFPPSTTELTMPCVNQTLNQTRLESQLTHQLNSPNGTLTTTPFGNTLTAFYAHNKLVEKFAQETQINPKQTLQCLTSFPLYFDNQSRYAKSQFLLDPIVANQVLTQNFTTAIYYNITFENSMFGETNLFHANFTCTNEFYTKQVNITAYQWDSNHKKWCTDDTVEIQATFDTAFNFTETDVLRSKFENQTRDQKTLQLAADDFYASLPQTFAGTGTIEDIMNRTSPLYYNLNITAKQNQHVAIVQRTIQMNFKNNKTYPLTINFDSTSPLQVHIIEDTTQTTRLTINAPTELGGLTNLSIYLITNAPADYALNETSVKQTDLRLLKTENLTLPQTQINVPPDYQQNYQLYQYIEGYSPIYENTLGFSGQTQISITKDPHITALPEYNTTHLYVEAKNVWGTKFHTTIAVQPFSTSHTEILLAQLAMYLFILIALAIILSLIAYFIKGRV